MIEALVRLAASVVAMDWLRMERDLQRLGEQPVDPRDHNITDGYFVADLSMGWAVVDALRPSIGL